MKKIIPFIVLALIVVVGIVYMNKDTDTVQEISANDYKNITYSIDGNEVSLVDGVSEVESAPGSSSKIVTTYFGNEIEKDFNGDGREDVAFLVTQNTGGSGTFFYVVGAVNTEKGYVGSQAVLLGDRIAPQTTESGPGNSILVNYLDRAPGEPMTEKPSVGKSIQLLLDTDTMQFGEVAQDFEGEADPARMTLAMKTWKWVKTQYSDDTLVEPKKDVFTLTFTEDGTFNATTDCNTIGGKYTSTDSAMTFSDTVSTLMYCDGSQEADFNSMLTNTSGYMFTSKGELVLTLKLDSGSVYFK
ncbi:MAG: META domain-containing protein [Candidatus Pacebacteria bacterium]|nr:META domain-containing protein [Candidatus Paceibacterota bacterium]